MKVVVIILLFIIISCVSQPVVDEPIEIIFRLEECEMLNDEIMDCYFEVFHKDKFIRTVHFYINLSGTNKINLN